MKFIQSVAVIALSILSVLNAANINADSDADRDHEIDLINNMTLQERLELQKITIHWLPYKRILVQEKDNGEVEEICWDRPRAIEEFPDGIWSRDQRRQGLFMIHIFAAVYLFIILAFICDKYFIPTVEVICTRLQISQDVAASTFMATATTIPEFFANTISTFIADSDMGLSAIIGSMLFNTLGVAACASLFTKKPIQIDWWPITRDSIVFSINISILVAFAWDGVIMWYETCVLVVLYFGYWVLMFQNPRIMKFVKGIVEDRLMWCQRLKNYDIANQRPYDIKPTTEENQSTPQPVENGSIENQLPAFYENYGFDQRRPSMAEIEAVKALKRRQSTDLSVIYEIQAGGFNDQPRPSIAEIEAYRAHVRRNSTDLSIIYEVEIEDEFKIWELPRGVSWFDLCWYFFTWPIRFILHYTIPNPLRYPNWYVFCFFMCIVWIAAVSYLVFWMVVIIGDVFNIPEAVMGLTFLAFGGCMPEAITSIIVARKGSGQMGVSNALGANSLAILFSLGLPWFIRTMADGAGFGEGRGAKIRIFSHGIEFTIMGLLLAVAILYISMAAVGYKLRKKVGGVLAIGYVLIATFAILVELDILFESSDTC